MAERMEDVSLFQAVWIGICQIASAVFPGTSRSMSTIAAGQMAGMSRAAALEFSFFVSLPTMLAATGYTLLKTLHPKAGEPLGRMPVNGHEWGVLIVGFVISFIVALAVVAWFMNWVRRRGFTPFAIYRIILGIAVLVWTAKDLDGAELESLRRRATGIAREGSSGEVTRALRACLERASAQRQR